MLQNLYTGIYWNVRVWPITIIWVWFLTWLRIEYKEFGKKKSFKRAFLALLIVLPLCIVFCLKYFILLVTWLGIKSPVTVRGDNKRPLTISTYNHMTQLKLFLCFMINYRSLEDWPLWAFVIDLVCCCLLFYCTSCLPCDFSFHTYMNCGAVWNLHIQICNLIW